MMIFQLGPKKIKISDILRFIMKHDYINIDRNGKSWNRVNYSTFIGRTLASPIGKSKLAQAMIAPIRRSLDYQGIARKLINIQPLPQGALPCYDKDIDVSSVVLDEYKYKHNKIRISRYGDIVTPDFKARKVVIPTFEIFSNPTIKLSDIKRKPLNLIQNLLFTEHNSEE